MSDNTPRPGEASRLAGDILGSRPDLTGPNIGVNIDLDRLREQFELDAQRIREMIQRADEQDRALASLRKIDHIVVLMLENRSFDHMLGYLSLEGGRTDVDGLQPGMANSTDDGRSFPINHLRTTVFEEDPAHHVGAVAAQLANNNGGFVKDFARRFPQADPGKIMGYYNAGNVPVYDFLAREFTICQRWFCSMPGPTWPNRMYALAGTSLGEKSNPDVGLEDVVRLGGVAQEFPAFKYDLKTFFRLLDDQNVFWRWYRQDIVATLRLYDHKYRLGTSGFAEHFDHLDRFFQHAASGELAPVSWIDPNWIDIGAVDNANDDHPPTDILHAQALVLDILNALANGPKWNETLFLIVYDEHGGFFDHVPPPPASDEQPDPVFDRHGPRVPALVVSPLVQRGGVSSIQFDHTSIPKTVLTRFCRGSSGAIPQMSARVASATHLGFLLTESAPRPFSLSGLATVRTRLNAIPRARTALARASTLPPNELQQQTAVIKAMTAAAEAGVLEPVTPPR